MTIIPMTAGSEKKPGQTPDEAENTEDTLRVPNSETASHTSEQRSVQEVRQGHTGDHMRYILIASIAGAIAVMVILGVFLAG